MGEPGVSSGHLIMMEQPAASDAAILRTAWVTGKFQGENPATGPIGSIITRLRTPSARAGMMRPYARWPSPAYQSTMSAPLCTSILASISTLPSSRVRTLAISSARARISSAALRRILPRSKADTLRHCLKPLSAAASALSRSPRETCPRVPMGLLVAGFITSWDLSPEGFTQLPSM